MACRKGSLQYALKQVPVKTRPLKVSRLPLALKLRIKGPHLQTQFRCVPEILDIYVGFRAHGFDLRGTSHS